MVHGEGDTNSKSVYSKNKEEALERAEKIAKKEGITGQASADERTDMSGGKYYNITWRQDG